MRDLKKHAMVRPRRSACPPALTSSQAMAVHSSWMQAVRSLVSSCAWRPPVRNLPCSTLSSASAMLSASWMSVRSSGDSFSSGGRSERQ